MEYRMFHKVKPEERYWASSHDITFKLQVPLEFDRSSLREANKDLNPTLHEGSLVALIGFTTKEGRSEPRGKEDVLLREIAVC